MCVIIYTPDGYIPKKHLKGGLDCNGDGWGIMWPENGTLQICTGMSKQHFFHEWKWIGKLRVPKVFHARIGTHGTKDVDNCHPFAVPGHGQLAVAHNGIIGLHSVTGSEKSDTRHFVDEILANLPQGFLDYPAILAMLSDYIGHSKLVFMDGEGEVSIVNEQLGYWEDKRWYSNKSCEVWKTTTTYGGGSTKYYNATTAGGSQSVIGFRNHHERTVVQENFPVYQEDEVAQELLRSRVQHGSYDDYDMANDVEWQNMVQARLDAEEMRNLRIARDAEHGCGIGVPAAVMGTVVADEPKTGLATIEDMEAQKTRQRELKKLEEVIRSRYPEDSPGAIAWRAKNEGKYPCELPDPQTKYAGYTDML